MKKQLCCEINGNGVEVFVGGVIVGGGGSNGETNTDDGVNKQKEGPVLVYFISDSVLFSSLKMSKVSVHIYCQYWIFVMK